MHASLGDHCNQIGILLKISKSPCNSHSITTHNQDPPFFQQTYIKRNSLMSNTQLLINQLQNVSTWGSLLTAYKLVSPCKQLTKTLGSKCPEVDWLIVMYCSSVNFAIINATLSLYSINIHIKRQNAALHIPYVLKFSQIANLLNIRRLYFRGCWEQIDMVDHLVLGKLHNQLISNEASSVFDFLFNTTAITVQGGTVRRPFLQLCNTCSK